MESLKSVILFSEQNNLVNAYSKQFHTSNHGGISLTYPEPIHYKSESGWKNIDNRLILDEESETYHNVDSALQIRFSCDTGKNKLFSVSYGGYTVSVEYLTARSDVRFLPSEKPEPKIDPDIYKAIFENAGLSMPPDPSFLEMHHVVYAGSYQDIAEGIDLEYMISGEKLKETIVLKEKRAILHDVSSQLRFRIVHPGLAIKKDKLGAMVLTDETGNVVLCLPELFTCDAKGAFAKVSDTKIEGGAGESLMTIIPDVEWLCADDRAWPVRIDPSIQSVQSAQTIQDTFVTSSRATTAWPASMESFTVGNTSSYGKCRALVRLRQLPVLEEGAVINKAQLVVFQYGFSSNSGAAFPVTAHAVTGAWTSGGVTWNTQPSWSSTVLDYASMGPVQSGSSIQVTPKIYDVTSLARAWYNTGANQGILLKARDESVRQSAVFVASDYPSGSGISSAQYPCGIFTWRSTRGLEDHYSYHTQDLGRAGTGYVNDYNGNLVYLHQDLATGEPILPVSISHVYNLSDRSTDRRTGRGWRLSFIQELDASGISDYPYVYTDAEGTRHYFYRDTEDGNKLKDEDGLGLVLVQTSSSSYDSYYIMEDKAGYRYVFGQDHFLRSITDPNGNAQTSQYGPSSAGNYLAWINTTSGHQILFHYLSSGKLGRIEYLGRSISYSYDQTGHLTRVIYPDGTSTEFSYDGDILAHVVRYDGTRINYSYLTDCGVSRVSEIREGWGPAQGQTLRLSYKNGNTTVFEEQGLDGDISSPSDNRIYTCHFDAYGSPSDLSDEDGRANSMRFYREGQKNNKLSHTGSLQRSVRNLIRNQAFRLNEDHWTKSVPSMSGYSIQRVTNCGFHGDHSMRIVNSADNASGSFSQQVTLSAGTYTFSAYVKVSGTGMLTGCGARLKAGHDNVEDVSVRTVSATTDTAIENGWRRLSVTFIMEAAGPAIVSAELFSMQGTAWFTCFQLEKGSVANKYNLIGNPGFVQSFGDVRGNWEVQGASGDGQISETSRGICGGLTGHPDQEKYLKQMVHVRGTEGDVFALGCWVKADAVPGRKFRIRAAVIYDTGSPKWVDIDCNPYVSDWQYVSGIILTDDEDSATVKRSYNAIHLFLAYDNQENRAYFSDIQLVMDDGASYVYDSDGNVTSAKSAAGRKNYAYAQNQCVSRVCDMTGVVLEYGYDSKKNLKTARNSEGLQYNISYDAKGLPTKGTIRSDRNSCAVTAGKQYMIRNLNSGKYLEVAYGRDQDGARVQQGDYNGSNAQKWTIQDCGNGYVRLVSATGSRVLSVENNAVATDTPVILMTDTHADGQLIKITYLESNACIFLPKCGKDKKALGIYHVSTAGGAACVLAPRYDTYYNQQWYFEPAESHGSDTPEDGGVFRLRLRHSGQYLAVEGGHVTSGTGMVQDYYRTELYQEFRFFETGNGYWQIRPEHADGMALSLAGNGTLTLALSASTDIMQQFSLQRNGNWYGIRNRNGMYLENAGASFTSGTAIHGTEVTGTPAIHQRFLLERCSDRMETSVAYSENAGNVMSVTDSRGGSVQNTYDADDRLLTSVTDALGNTVHYTYDTDTDHLTEVHTTAGGQEVSVSYSYDDADRLTEISHNGFTYQYEYDHFDNETKVTAGDVVLQEKEYLSHDGPLSKVRFGNGDVLKNTYDKQLNITEQSWNDEPAWKYSYDDFGDMVRVEDLSNGMQSEYSYDLLHRLTGLETSFGQKLSVHYDEKNRISAIIQITGDRSKAETSYLYGNAEQGQKPGLLYGLMVDDTLRAEYSWDELARRTACTIHLDGTDYITSMSYLQGNRPGLTTCLVQELINGDSRLSYSYDLNGNITSISENGIQKTRYTYDGLNRLVRTDSLWEDKTITWSYDAGGNILERREYVYTTGTPETLLAAVPYTYRTSGWRDQLISYNGEAITYDGGGNPLSYRGMTMTWYRGSRLSSITRNGETAVYRYDNEGRRNNWRGLDGLWHHDYWNGDQLMATAYGDTMLHFIYDEAGNPFAIRLNGQDYYYIRNLQGDVTGIINSSGQQIVEYSYDSWGKPLTAHAVTLVGNQLLEMNPLRYRGYCYDSDTGLYYIKNRYYDSVTGRFISVDTIDILSVRDNLYDINLFVYCDNNPIYRKDIEGKVWVSAVLFGAIAGVLGQYASDVINNWIEGKQGAELFQIRSSKKDYFASACGGIIAAIPCKTLLLTAGVGAVGSLLTDAIKGNIKTFDDAYYSAYAGAITNSLGYIVSKVASEVVVNRIEKLPRSAKKRVANTLLNGTHCDINKNYHAFNIMSRNKKIELVEKKFAVFTIGIYSTGTSTLLSLLRK